MNRYQDRQQAGKLLATYLTHYTNQPQTLVLALPRGGVPVGYEIAMALNLPLDIFIVRKLGVPQHDELAMGAMASGGMTVFNQDIVKTFSISSEDIQNVIQKETQEMQRREKAYRGNRAFPDIAGKTLILVDDGIATGATLRAAIHALRTLKPEAIIVAIPIAEKTSYDALTTLVDKIICPLIPTDFSSVGSGYNVFPQVSDEEVSRLLSYAL